jgi:hypothetical protein
MNSNHGERGMNTCEIVPFPARHRVGYIRNMAWLLAGYRPAAAERTLVAQLKAQRQAMLQRGIRPDVVEREACMLEYALRAALSDVMFGGDAA